MKNILLNLSVKSGHTGDWRAAIDEAFVLSKKLNIGCAVNYANQYSIIIEPEMTQEDINKIKEYKMVIGL